MEQEMESLVPVSNGYLYQFKVGEMRGNAKGPQNVACFIIHLPFIPILASGVNLLPRSEVDRHKAVSDDSLVK